MHSKKTRPNAGTLAGLQGVFNFEQTPSSPSVSNFQLPNMRGYRIDPQSMVEPIWRRHHG